jgi:hypothetical protein
MDSILWRGGQAANNSVPPTSRVIAAILAKVDELRVTIFLRCRRNRISLNPATSKKFLEPRPLELAIERRGSSWLVVF